MTGKNIIRSCGFWLHLQYVTLNLIQNLLCFINISDSESLSGITNNSLSKRDCKVKGSLAKDAAHKIFLPLFSKAAFTLAEVLITIGIIGVVAAMTIPGLMTAYKAHQLRAQFLKSYSTVQQAFRRMEADDVSTDISAYSGKMGSFYNTFKQYFSGIHECGVYSNTSDILPCAGFAKYGTNNKQVYKTYTGRYNLARGIFDDGQFALSDGTLVLIENPNGFDRVWIFVDINGFGKLPNRLGYDLFTFEFINGELRTMGDRETTYNDLEKYCNPKIANGLNGIACAHKAKTKTDYFKSLVKEFK